MKMKIPKLLRRKTLRATAARRSLRASAEMGYDEMSEPNMKLSRALLIVLVLHIVAVSGIIAFNAIKTRQGSFVASVPATTAADPAVTAASTIKSDASNSRPAATQKENARRVDAKPLRSPAKSVAKDEHKTDRVKTNEHASADSGKVYTVAKGENPVAIAKKLKVSYDDLIALNHIDDPRKIQIGQKLLIPNKTLKAKKSDE
jgi:LysM repeat protein